MPALSGEQIVERWPIIKAALKLSALPTADTNEDKLLNIYKALMSGRAVCWMTGNIRKPRTVVIITISIEEISGTRNMLMYCAHGFEKEKNDQYLDILKGLRDYAKGQKCDNIIAYIWNDKMKEILKSYGAECDYTLAVFPLH